MNEEKRERREKEGRKDQERNEKGTRKERERREKALSKRAALVVAAIMLMYSSKRDFFIRKRGRKKGRRHRKEKSWDASAEWIIREQKCWIELRHRFTLDRHFPRHLCIRATVLHVFNFLGKLGKLLCQPLSCFNFHLSLVKMCDQILVCLIMSSIFSWIGYSVSTTDSSGRSSGHPKPLKLPQNS